MQTLADRKCDNYLKIIEMLGKLELAAIHSLTSVGVSVAKDRMTDKLYMYDEFERILIEFVEDRDAPGLFQQTETGWSVTMISPESKNEETPAMNVLKLDVIGDIFRAKTVVQKAFLELLDN